MWQKVARLHRLRQIWRYAFVLAGGCFVVIVMAGSHGEALAQNVITPTPPSYVIEAQQTATAAAVQRSRAQRDLGQAQVDAQAAIIAAQEAQDNVKSAQSAALAQNLQETLNRAAEADRLAQTAIYSATRALDRIAEIESEFTQLGQLQAQVTNLQGRLSAAEAETQALRAVPKPEAPNWVPLAYVVGLVLTLVTIGAIFFLPRKVKYVPVAPIDDTDQVIDQQ